MSIELLTILLFVSLFALLSTGLQIAFCLGAVAVVFTIAFWGFDHLSILSGTAYTSLQNVNLVAVPLFILMGWIIYKSGIADDLFSVIDAWFGNIKGGLAIGVIFVSVIFGAICGDLVAAIFTITAIAFPIMIKQGYNKSFSSGVVLSGALLSFIVPPSILMIIYASVTNLSIGKLYLACFVPGFILAGLYMIYVFIVCRFRPKISGYTSHSEIKYNWKSRFTKLGGIIPSVILLLAMLIGIYAGIVTPMEASAVGAVGALIIAIIKRRLNWKTLSEAVTMTGQLTCMLALMMLAASCFTVVYVGLGASDLAISIIARVPGGGIVVVIAMEIILLIVGMLMDSTAIILIFGPIFQGIVQALGYDPVWFAVLFMINMQTGILSPPYGTGLFFEKAAILSLPGNFDIKLMDVIMGSFPFMVMQIACLFLVLVVPAIALFVPNLLIK